LSLFYSLTEKNSKRIEALVDTGCNSFIKISKSVVIELGLIPLEKNSVGNTELATGEKVEIKFYKDITLSLLSHENVDQELCVRSINVNPYAHEQLGSDNSNFLLGLQSLHDIGVLIDCADYKLKIKTLEKLVIPNKRKRLND